MTSQDPILISSSSEEEDSSLASSMDDYYYDAATAAADTTATFDDDDDVIVVNEIRVAPVPVPTIDPSRSTIRSLKHTNNDQPRRRRGRPSKKQQQKQTSQTSENNSDNDVAAPDNNKDEMSEELKAQMARVYDELQTYLENIPPADHPWPLKTELLPHQLQACSWMENHEFLYQGGILADDMGLGKTMSTLALLCNPEKKVQTLIVCPVSLLHHWEKEIQKHVLPDYFNVCVYYNQAKPTSLEVLQQADVVLTTYHTVSHEYGYWIKQGFSHDQIAAGTMPLTDEHLSQGRFLHLVNWPRLVLDEAQYIKNRTTGATKVCNALIAANRWCLTGTPICNSLDDLYSLFTFIRIVDYPTYDTWKHQIKMPVDGNDPEGHARLTTLVKKYVLRRRKDQWLNGKPIVELPEVQNHLLKLPFEASDKIFYKRVEDSLNRQFAEMARLGKQYVMRNYSHVWAMLLRKRQAACHPYLVAAGYSEVQEGQENQPPQPSQRGGRARKWDFEFLESIVQTVVTAVENDNVGNDDAIVQMLSARMDEAVTKDCKDDQPKLELANDGENDEEESDPFAEAREIDMHWSSELVFDKQEQVFKMVYKKRSHDEMTAKLDAWMSSSEEEEETTELEPKRAKHATKNGAFTDMTPKIATSANHQILTRNATKLQALLDALELIRPTQDKVVIYSQFTSYMDLIQAGLDQAGWAPLRLDGTMSQKARANAVDVFDANPKRRVLLVSLKAGGVGLNLTVANHIYLMDPWWNSAIEQQAMDRVRRIGQTKKVFVTRFVVEESIEDRILDIQEEKNQIADLALANHRGDRKAARGLTFAQLKSLFTSSF